MKKFTSFFLCALTIMTLSLTAFAAPAPDGKSGETMSGSNKPSAEVQATTHTCIGGETVGYTWDTHISYINNDTCGRRGYIYKRCVICGDVVTEISYTDTASHSGSVYAASCSGTVQTWHCTCSKCGGHFTKTITCPGGPHTPGYCKVLPV